MGNKDDILHEEFVVTQNFCGPKLKRKSTDVICVLLLLCCWAAMTCIGLASLGVIKTDQLDEGDPNRLISGVDYKGNICGVDGKVKNFDKKWEPNSLKEFGICVKSCPEEGESREDIYTGDVYTADAKTVNVVGYCVPDLSSRHTDLALDTFGDFIRSAALIGVTGFVFSVGLCIAYLYFIRIPFVLHVIVWINIIIVEVGLIVGAYLMIEKAKAEQDNDNPAGMTENQVLMLRGLGTVLAIMAVLWICVVCFLRERISVAVDLVEEAAECVTSLGSLPLFCLMMVAGFVLFSALWLLYATYLVSSAKITTHRDDLTGWTYKEFEYNHRAKQSVIFLVFMWLWTTAFIQSLGQITFAHAVLVWYFAESRNILGDYQIFYSLGTVARYHSGTAAFGSLILAVVNMIRITLTYLKKKFADPENSMHRCVMKCLFCCLKCFEECIKFINKHAYIQCAFEGNGFMHSALRAYGLISRNILRVAVVSAVGSLAIFIGKITVMIICAGLAYLYLDNFLEDEVTGLFFPTVFVAFIAYLTASFFLDVLSVATDTLLQAFLIEEEFDRNARKGKCSVLPKRSPAGEGITRVLDHTASGPGVATTGSNHQVVATETPESRL